MSDLNFVIKVYDRSDVFTGLLRDITDIKFSKYVNAGLGELILRYPRPIDQYGEGIIIDDMYKVEVIIRNAAHNDGLTIYSGFCDTRMPVREGTREYVDIHCLGYGAMLNEAIHKDGIDVTMNYSATDVDDVVKDIVDKYRAFEANTPVNYSGTSVEASSNTITDAFNSMTVTEALERCRDKAGTNWYWYVDADNVFHFKSKPTSATHSLILGKHIAPKFRLIRSCRDVKNRVLFWNGLFDTDSGLLSKWYFDNTYDSTYWKRVEKITDGRITVAATAQALSDAFISSRLTRNYGVDVVVNNKYYDIFNIKVGDTVKILNVEDTTVFSDNMMVYGIDLDVAGFTVLHLEDLRALTSRSLQKIRRFLDRVVYDDGQPNYTAVDVS